MSFTVEKHYCCGNLVDFSLFSDVQDCEGETLDFKEVVTEKKCCTNVVDVVIGQDKVTVNTVTNFECIQQLFLSNIIYSLSSVIEVPLLGDIIYTDYSPPNLVVDNQILNQIFII